MVSQANYFRNDLTGELFEFPIQAIASENESKAVQHTSSDATINMDAQIEKLYAEAREQTLETLPEFLEQVSAIARYDWNCNKGIAAIAISAIAASWAMESDPDLGTSNSSARYVMHEYMMRYGNISTPANVVEYMDMLRPSNARHFERTLSPDTWRILQDEAAKRLKNVPAHMHMPDEVRTHLQSIVDGVPPFGYDIEVD